MLGRGPKTALKKGAHLGPLNEGERARETRAAHPLLTLLHPTREVGVLKRHGVGDGESELGADFAVIS